MAIALEPSIRFESAVDLGPVRFATADGHQEIFKSALPAIDAALKGT